MKRRPLSALVSVPAAALLLSLLPVTPAAVAVDAAPAADVTPAEYLFAGDGGERRFAPILAGRLLYEASGFETTYSNTATGLIAGTGAFLTEEGVPASAIARTAAEDAAFPWTAPDSGVHFRARQGTGGVITASVHREAVLVHDYPVESGAVPVADADRSLLFVAAGRTITGYQSGIEAHSRATDPLLSADDVVVEVEVDELSSRLAVRTALGEVHRASIGADLTLGNWERVAVEGKALALTIDNVAVGYRNASNAFLLTHTATVPRAIAIPVEAHVFEVTGDGKWYAQTERPDATTVNYGTSPLNSSWYESAKAKVYAVERTWGGPTALAQRSRSRYPSISLATAGRLTLNWYGTESVEPTSLQFVYADGMVGKLLPDWDQDVSHYNWAPGTRIWMTAVFAENGKLVSEQRDEVTIPTRWSLWGKISPPTVLEARTPVQLNFPQAVTDQVRVTWRLDGVDQASPELVQNRVASFTPAPQDIGKRLSVLLENSEPGWYHTEQEEIDLGTVAPSSAKIVATGSQVGSPITVSLNGPGITGADSATITWTVDGEVVASGPTHTFDRSWAGKQVSVTATLDSYDVTPLAPFTLSRMNFSNVGVTSSGTPKVGEVVTAVPAVEPAPEVVEYRWYLDGVRQWSLDQKADVRLTPTMQGKKLSVQIVASATGINQRWSNVHAVGTVAAGEFTTPVVSVDGDLRVGTTATASVTASPVPTAAEWSWTLDDGTVVGEEDELPLVPAWAGQEITATASISTPGYEKEPVTKTITVRPGLFSDLEVEVSGDPRVGGTLHAQASASPQPSGTTWTWTADGVEVGTGSDLVLTGEHVGADVVARATVTASGYAEDSVSSTAVNIAEGHLPAMVASISGDAVVGARISAELDDAGLEPDEVAWEWFADGEALGVSGRFLTLTAEHLGAVITVKASVEARGYASGAFTSGGTDRVAVGDLPAMVASISGDAVVEGQLTAEVAATTVPFDEVVWQWFADGTALDESGPVLTLTPEHVGSVITATATVRTRGYRDGSVATQATSAVRLAPAATVRLAAAGTVKVGETVTATAVGDLDGSETLTYTWTVDGETHTERGEALLLTPAMAGARVSVVVRAARRGHEEAVSAPLDLGTVALGAQVTPVVEVAGTLAHGNTLKATTDVLHPDATASFTWTVDGKAAGEDATLDLTRAMAGGQVAVKMVLTRAGYESVQVTRVAGRVAELNAPTVQLSVDDTSVRAGDSVTLTWTSTEATVLTASGAWQGTLPSSGSRTVKVTKAGTHRFSLNATGHGGEVTSAAVVVAKPGPKALSVTATKVRVGKNLTTRVRGLEPYERARVKVAGRGWKSTRTVTANSQGRAKIVVRAKKVGTVRITTVGSFADRAGRATTTVRAPKVSRAHIVVPKAVRAGDRASVRVIGLAPRERVTVLVDGAAFVTGRADRAGTYVTRVAAGRLWAQRTVTAVPSSANTKVRGPVTFRVVKRCGQPGVHVCR